MWWEKILNSGVPFWWVMCHFTLYLLTRYTFDLPFLCSHSVPLLWYHTKWLFGNQPFREVVIWFTSMYSFPQTDFLYPVPDLLNKWYALSDSAFVACTRTICPILTTVFQSLLLPFFPFHWMSFSILLCLVEQLQQDMWRPSHPKRSSSLRIKSCHAEECCKQKTVFLDRARYWSLSELHQLVHLTLSTFDRFSLLPVWSCWSYAGSHCQAESLGNGGCHHFCSCGESC